VSAFGQLRHVIRDHPRAADLVLAACLGTVTLLTAASASPAVHGRLTVAPVFVAVAACGVLMWRRRWPVAVLALAIGGAVTFHVLSGAPRTPLIAAPVIVFYSMAADSGWRRTVAAGGAVVAVLAVADALAVPGSLISATNVALVTLNGLAVATGEAIRNRRAYIAAVEERARRAERDREQEADRRVTSERLRIARDLHDVLGHQIALINIQAGAAEHVLDGHPDQARQALVHIREACRSALDGLGDTVGLLREPPDAMTSARPGAGLAGLAGLEELVASFRRSGLQVAHEAEGQVRPLPPATDMTVYRIIQESLTNVSKHAHGTAANVRLMFGPQTLGVVVDNESHYGRNASDRHRPASGPGPCPVNGGHGLSGMRERVAVMGGNLDAGPRPGGGFRVSAWLPLPAEGETA
jgi:signal transduction histidine kinase